MTEEEIESAFKIKPLKISIEELNDLKKLAAEFDLQEAQFYTGDDIS